MRRSIRCLVAASAVAAAAAVSVPSVSQATAPGHHNGLIAFVRNGQIYTVDSSGHHLRQLTHKKGLLTAGQPEWSPNGRHIAYVQLGDFGVPYLWEMSADGAQKHKLWKGVDPAWSPDGSKLAYVETEVLPVPDPNAGCEYHELFTRPLSGGTARLIDDEGAGGCTHGGIPTFYGSEIAWSQNQKLVYFGIAEGDLVGADQKYYSVAMFIAGAHTAGTDVGAGATTKTIEVKDSVATMDKLTTFPPAPTVDAAPTKDNVVYSEVLATDDVSAGEVRQESITNNSIHLLSEAKDTTLPAYSPDGTAILFVEHKAGKNNPFTIKRITLKTGKIVSLLRGSQPDWQPT